MRRTLGRLALAALALALAFGCTSAREEDRGLVLWFPVDPELNMVSAALDACPYQGTEHTIPALMSALLAGPPEEEQELTSLIPAGTRVLSWSLEEGVASVELSAAYAGLVGVDLTLADCCITLTLAQLPGVEGVRVTVNGGGQSYRDRRVLYPEDMLLAVAEESPAEVTAALYFRREGGDQLGFELRRFRLSEDRVPVKEVLDALAAGPEDEVLVPLLPEGLAVRSAWVDQGLCTADLSAALLDLPEGRRALAVSSIAETLRSLDGVEQVQILIEGEPVGAVDGLVPSPLPP
jgi:germination protein M